MDDNNVLRNVVVSAFTQPYIALEVFIFSFLQLKNLNILTKFQLAKLDIHVEN